MGGSELNHRIEEYSRYLTSAMKGINEVDIVDGTNKAYHLKVIKEYETAMKNRMQELSVEIGLTLNLDELVVTASNNGENEIRFGLTHKIFSDLSEETMHKRLQFSEMLGRQTGIYFPIVEQTVKRVVLEIKLEK